MTSMQPPSDNLSNAFGPSDLAESGQFDAEVILEQVLEDPRVSQFAIRHRFKTDETLSTYVRCNFEVGQLRYILHVPFYPHFSAIPLVTANILDEHAGRARVTDQQKFGTRVEITLDAPTSLAKQVLVEVVASAQIPVRPGCLTHLSSSD